MDLIPITEPLLDGNELDYLKNCIASGWVSWRGEYVEKFEEGFARFCGSSYAVSTSSGTSALHLALCALGVGIGDEVILPTLSYIATANAVSYTGAKAVFADCETGSWNISPDEVRKKVTARTKAIIPVHLYGTPADMDGIMEIAREYNLYVIEDACQAHGAEYKGRRVGSIGHIGVFSFYGNKIITTGEGGMVVTDNEKMAEKTISLKNHSASQKTKYWHEEIGYNYRMTNLQAAVGVAQLERIEEFIETRRKIARQYRNSLDGIKGIGLPPETHWGKSVYWFYSIMIEDEYGIGRDELIKKLAEEGIESLPLFKPIHLMPLYFKNEKLHMAENLSIRGFSLPSFPRLKKEDIEKIVRIIEKNAKSS